MTILLGSKRMLQTLDLLHSFLIKWSGKTRETRGQGDKGEIDGLGDQKTSVYLIVMSLKKLFMRIGLLKGMVLANN